MNKLIIFFRAFLICSFFIIFILSIIFAYYTILDLHNNYQLDLSYQGCIIIFEKFKLCFIFIAALIPTTTLIIHIEQRRITQINADNQEIKLLYEALLKEAETNKNKSICDSIKQRGLLIIKSVYYLNTTHRIKNKKELSKILEKNIASEIEKYEDFECRNRFSNRLFYVENDVHPHAYDSFKSVSMYMLIPTFEYQKTIDNDLKELYFNKVQIIAIENANFIRKNEYENFFQDFL